MKLFLYSIYDKVACVFNKPFTELNNQTAIRSFDQSLKDNPHIKDYELYKLAEYSDHNGEIDPVPIAKIRTGLDLIHEIKKGEEK